MTPWPGWPTPPTPPPTGPPRRSADGADAERAADEVREAVDAHLGTTGRLRRFFDPRPLWAGRARRHRTG